MLDVYDKKYMYIYKNMKHYDCNDNDHIGLSIHIKIYYG